MRNIYLDCETTGFSPGNICQLTMIIEDNGSITDAKNYFFKIDYITKGAQELLGRDISFYDKASNGERFSSKAEEIASILNDGIAIGHNVKFDINFISTELWRNNKILRLAGSADTMEYSKDIVKIPAKNRKYGVYKNPKLEELANYLCIDNSMIDKLVAKLFMNDDSSNLYHDSRFDTTVTFVCFNIIKEITQKKAGYWSETFRLKGSYNSEASSTKNM